MACSLLTVYKKYNIRIKLSEPTLVILRLNSNKIFTMSDYKLVLNWNDSELSDKTVIVGAGPSYMRRIYALLFVEETKYRIKVFLGPEAQIYQIYQMRINKSMDFEMVKVIAEMFFASSIRDESCLYDKHYCNNLADMILEDNK